MIRGANLLRPGVSPLLRAAGLVVVAVLVFLAVAGALHVGDAGHDGHACSVCAAILSVGGAAIGGPIPTSAIAPTQGAVRATLAPACPVLSFDGTSIAAPRGPPAAVSRPRLLPA